MDNALLVALSSLIVYSLTFVFRLNFGPDESPPSPRGIPFFGNEFQIPKTKQWLYFDELRKKYGEIVYLRILGQHTIILGSAKAALELLETRGSIYSNRPNAVMAGELVGWDKGLGYAPYGERFKEFRRLFHQSMGPRSVQDLYPIQEAETYKLLQCLIEKPKDFIHHARQSAGSLVLKVAYGYTAQLENDPLVDIAEKAMQGFSEASEPGAFMVDRFPFLRYLPHWLPGVNFKEVARKMRGDLIELYDVPFNFVKSQMVSSGFEACFTSRYIVENGPLSDSESDFIKAAAASLYSGGADTTPSSITAFILAMTLYPDVQARGHAEVRALLGDGRLPVSSDRYDLPYVGAIVKEVLRWNPAVPLGLPHQVICDDEYEGYKIKKGTVVWANIWSMLHDPSVFPEPDVFKPERFIENGRLKNLERSKDPSFLAFGFGRRICPGMHLAENSIFLAIASILQVFEIEKAKSFDGQAIIPEVDFNGFISHPKPFVCTIRPRSPACESLVKHATQ